MRPSIKFAIGVILPKTQLEFKTVNWVLESIYKAGYASGMTARNKMGRRPRDPNYDTPAEKQMDLT